MRSSCSTDILEKHSFVKKHGDVCASKSRTLLNFTIQEKNEICGDTQKKFVFKSIAF